jgi:hypothetical protein
MGVCTMIPVTVTDVRLEKDPRGKAWCVTADVELGAGVKVRATFTLEQAHKADLIERVKP